MLLIQAHVAVIVKKLLFVVGQYYMQKRFL